MNTKKIKRNIKILSTFLLLNTGVASVANANSFDSFYTGFGIGESLSTARLRTQTVSSAINTSAVGGATLSGNSSYNETLSKDSFFGSIYGGYGFSCNPYYLGGELFVKISNNNISNGNSAVFFDNVALETAGLNETTSLNFRKVEFGLDARPGILLSACSLLYGRIGIAFNKVSATTTINSLLVDGTGAGFGISPILQSFPMSDSKNLGLRLGFGLERMLFKCFSVKLDYIFTRYRNIHLSNSSASTVVQPLQTVSTTFSDTRTIKPVNHSFMLGFSYYW